MSRGGRALAIATAILVALSGCGVTIPSDPHGTLDRVTGGVLRVGVTHNDPWVVVDSTADPVGDEPALLREFAARLDAQLVWNVDSEGDLVGALERGELDVVIGGFTDRTPWSDRAAMTVPYTQATGDEGRSEKHVMLVRMGENRFLVELESFLLREGERG